MKMSFGKLSLPLLLGLIVITNNALSQSAELLQAPATCPAGIPETANDADFLLLENGEVLHIASNLIFMRCSVGQTWDGNTCVNEPQSFTWQQALQESMTNASNNRMSWRLPNVKELSVIIERACVRPAINDTIFPNTSPDDYWSSSPNVQNEQAAWSVAFSNGSITPRLKTRSLFIRLVRSNVGDVP